MIKFLLIINLIFFSTIFGLDCNDLIISTENSIELKVLINQLYYKATLEIKGSPDKDIANRKFNSGSKLKIGTNEFLAKSCYTKDTKSYILIELMPTYNVELEFDSPDSELENREDLKKEEIINLLTPKVKTDTGSIIFKKPNTKRQIRKRKSSSDSDDDGSDMESPPRKKNYSSSQIYEEKKISDTELDHDMEGIESQQYQSTSADNKKKVNQTICSIIFENGSGNYVFVDSRGDKLTVYVYLFDNIKHWYEQNSYSLQHTSKTPDSIIDAHENILKNCSDIKDSTRAKLEFLTRSMKVKSFNATSIISIVHDVIGQHKFKLHSNDLDEEGIYSFYDENNVSVGEANLRKPYNTEEVFTDPDNSSISIHYQMASLSYNEGKVSHQLVSITLRHNDHDKHYYDMNLKIASKTMSNGNILTPFRSFIKSKDKSDLLLNVDEEKKLHSSDGKIYRESIQNILKKLQLPSFGKINFCDLLFFPEKYKVYFKSSKPIYLRTTFLQELRYKPMDDTVEYLFSSNSGDISCFYSDSGSKISIKKDFIKNVEVYPSQKYFVNESLKVFLDSNNQCLNLTTTGSYLIHHNFDFSLKPEVMINGIYKMNYSFTDNTFFVYYKNSTFSNRIDYKEQFVPLDLKYCFSFKSDNYLGLFSSNGFKSESSRKYKFYKVEKKK